MMICNAQKGEVSLRNDVDFIYLFFPFFEKLDGDSADTRRAESGERRAESGERRAESARRRRDNGPRGSQHAQKGERRIKDDD